MKSFKDLLFKNKKDFFQKLIFFKICGEEKLQLFLDFDRTLTQSRNRRDENITSWEILRKRLPPEGKKEYLKLYNKYRPLEIKNKLKTVDAIYWWESVMNLYIKYKVKWSNIKNDVTKEMFIRPCVKELFDICDEKNIPTIIISAGIKNIIELWCQKFKIRPTKVLGTKLFFDSKGYIKKWDKKHMIHILNKREKGHKEISRMRKIRPNIILIGDNIEDASMVEGTENVLRVMVNDPRKDEALEKKQLSSIFKKFDLVIKNKSLCPIIDLINLFS